MDPYLGEIRIFAGTYAPQGWALCQGQLLAIRQYTALFALLGVNYGGNGTTTFGLPDLRGRLPVGTGQSPGNSNYAQGVTTGAETVALTLQNIGAHTHLLQAGTSSDSSSPAGNVLAAFPGGRGGGTTSYAPASAATPGAMSSQALSGSGGSSQPHDNMQPYLTLNFIIALQGIFPPRP